MRKLNKTGRPANRRIRGNSPRNHLLDVKIRTSTARRRRRETATRWVTKAVVLALLAAGSIYGVREALDKFFFHNPEYTLQRITVELDGVLTREELLSMTGLREGVNIFSVDLGAVERTLRAVPEAASVRIERRLPSELSVQLAARRPVAWVALQDEGAADPRSPEKSLLTDEAGFLVRARHLRPEYLHLPIIYGVRSDNLHEGEGLQDRDFLAALELLKTVSGRPDSLLDIRSLNVEKGYCVTVVSGQNARIVFGMKDFPEQLARLDKLLAHCQETGRTLDAVNLMVRRNTPVTFLVAAAPLPEESRELPALPQVKSGKTRKN